MIARDMRKLAAADDVADGVDALVRRAKPVIDLDARLVEFDFRRFKIEVVDRGLAPDSDKKMRAGNCLAVESDTDAVGIFDHRVDQGVFVDLNPFAQQLMANNVDKFRIVLVENGRAFNN